MVNLQKDDYVLDMGSGIGGQAFLMAKVRVETWVRESGARPSLWQR